MLISEELQQSKTTERSKENLTSLILDSLIWSDCCPESFFTFENILICIENQTSSKQSPRAQPGGGGYFVHFHMVIKPNPVYNFLEHKNTTLSKISA